jgi:hypothetical protein
MKAAIRIAGNAFEVHIEYLPIPSVQHYPLMDILLFTDLSVLVDAIWTIAFLWKLFQLIRAITLVLTSVYRVRIYSFACRVITR